MSQWNSRLSLFFGLTIKHKEDESSWINVGDFITKLVTIHVLHKPVLYIIWVLKLNFGSCFPDLNELWVYKGGCLTALEPNSSSCSSGFHDKNVLTLMPTPDLLYCKLNVTLDSTMCNLNVKPWMCCFIQYIDMYTCICKDW